MNVGKLPPETSDYFIGTVRETNGVKLEITGIKQISNRGIKTYSCVCDLCSDDVELYPDGFCITKGNFKSGKNPCGCAKNPQWSRYQYYVMVKRICISRDLTFIRFIGNSNTQKDKLEIQCNVCSSLWNKCHIGDFLNGKQKCPICSRNDGNTKRSNKSFVDVELLEICNREGYIYIGYPTGYKNNKELFKYVCTTHGDNWSSYSNFKRGRRCSGCKTAGGYKKNKVGFYYIFRWDNGNERFCKHGITNHPYARLEQQSKSTSYKPTNVLMLEFNDGKIPPIIEKIIMDEFSMRFVSESIFSDGFTETFNPLFLKDILIRICEYLIYEE